MGKARQRYKDHAARREAGGFVAFPSVVLRSQEFAALSPAAVKLLCDLLAQYNGSNNGDLGAAWKLMKPRGWRSKDTLARAIAALRAACFVIVTRQGGRHTASLYALTFYEVDFCGGKLEIKAPSRSFLGTWRRTPPAPFSTLSLPRRAGHSTENCPAGRANSSSGIPDCPASRVSQADFDQSIDTTGGALYRLTTTSRRSAFAESI
jgi:hypothetical protein